MSIRRGTLAVGLIMLLQGCTTVNPSNLYWGNYQGTLYDVKISPGEESTLKHKAELESIIEESGSLEAKVPPGVYAELGFLHFNAGDAAKAKEFYTAEAELYPESEKLMKILIEDAGKTDSPLEAKAKENK